MIGILIVVASCVAMYRIADAEGRSGLAWAGITLLLCLVCAFTIPLPLIAEAMGLLIAFVLMTIAKMRANA